jgi:hypothetical protein
MPGNEIGVEMAEEDMANVEIEPPCVRQILLHIALRIDDDSSGTLLVSDQIGGMSQAAQVILFEDHGNSTNYLLRFASATANSSLHPRP